jgi:hypothetical protein
LCAGGLALAFAELSTLTRKLEEIFLVISIFVDGNYLNFTLIFVFFFIISRYLLQGIVILPNNIHIVEVYFGPSNLIIQFSFNCCFQGCCENLISNVPLLAFYLSSLVLKCRVCDNVLQVVFNIEGT